MTKNDFAAGAVPGTLATFSLLTRLPLPVLGAGAFAAAPRHTYAFALVGAVVGALAALGGWAALWLGLPLYVAAGCVLTVSVILTGAMHEDGLADTADGFWGGFEPARRLDIMRDSQIGSYGVLALVLVTGLRWGAVASLLAGGVGPVIAAAVLSRSVLPMVMAFTAHARSDGLSHGVGRPPVGSAALALGLGALIAYLCVGIAMLGALVAVGIVAFAVRQIALSKIGGQTGDVLGATQQIAELGVLLCLLAIGGA
jgi:adenosylcobinamide-GDP ribazoletransferase